MPFITLSQVKANGRIDEGADDVDLQQKIDMAEALVIADLKCNVYADQTALNVAIAAVPAMLSAAKAAYVIAEDDADAMTDYDLAIISKAHASSIYMRSLYEATRIRSGVVVNAQIIHAMLLATEWANENRGGEKDIPESISRLLDNDRCYA